MFFGGNPIVGRHLTARAAEVAGFDAPHECEDFVKSMKAGGLGGHGGTLLHGSSRRMSYHWFFNAGGSLNAT